MASDLDKYPEPKPGLVFRYDYLRPREFADGTEHGKVRPACVLVPLKEGEVFRNVTVIDETSKRTTANYVAGKNDIAIICIQTDPPDKNQLGVKLDLQTTRYIGLPHDKESWAIVSEVNIDTWPSSGMNHIPGKPAQFVYPRPMPGPMMAQLAKLFLRLCELKKIWSLRAHPRPRRPQYPTTASRQLRWRAPRPSPWLLAATAYQAAASTQYGPRIVGNPDFTGIFAVVG